MPVFNGIPTPADGAQITVEGGKLVVPDNPVIPFIEGDGTGVDIWAASVRVFDAAVAKAYQGQRRIAWYEIFAGEKAFNQFNEWLPKGTLEAIQHFVVAIKGPLTTPVGGGIRSLNVALRQVLDLYACVRPVRYFDGVPSPVKNPEKLDVVIFRENTEDVYSGIEFQEGTERAKKLIDFLGEWGYTINADSGIGIKPISITGTRNLVRRAIQYAVDQKRTVVTLVHKGNIMKFTEGAFRDWGYQLAKDEFREQIVTEDELWKDHGGKLPAGKILVNDRIADAMFQQVILRPDEYQVIATPNLNGDYKPEGGSHSQRGMSLTIGKPKGAMKPEVTGFRKKGTGNPVLPEPGTLTKFQYLDDVKRAPVPKKD
ncbi:MAG: NADP-dependent isocitrate dehydrogenase, partial [Acidobacteria bacterium]|nr:NADP-dependent isocitrate dehydrogenase [Acidobacteriota bacterium]